MSPAVTYSKLKRADVWAKIGFNPDLLIKNFEEFVSVDSFLSSHSIAPEISDNARQELNSEVLCGLQRCLEIHGYPSQGSSTYNEGVVSKFIDCILNPVLFTFKKLFKPSHLTLNIEKRIESVDGTTSGKEDYVVMYTATIENYLLIIEAKASNLGSAYYQCIVSMTDMYQSNGDGNTIYGFMATSSDWQMITYDGEKYQLYDDMHILDCEMVRSEELWMRHVSKIVDVLLCIFTYGELQAREADEKKGEKRKHVQLKT